MLLGQERKWGTCRRMPWGQAVAPGVLGLRVRMPGLVRPRRTQGNLAGQEELSECRSQTSALRSWGGAAGGSLAGVPISPWQAYCGLQGPRKQPTRLVVYRPAVGDGVPAKGSFELVGGEEATSD